MSERVCDFCNGKPVLNATAWTTRDVPRYAACPRCGELNVPDDERERELERRAAHDDGVRQARERFERDARRQREWTDT